MDLAQKLIGKKVQNKNSGQWFTVRFAEDLQEQAGLIINKNLMMISYAEAMEDLNNPINKEDN